jgi:hypothetical protein
LRRFQAGELPEQDEEWHRLVPPEAREALGKMEVQRQSVIFELFKAEKDYVFDLESVREVHRYTLVIGIASDCILWDRFSSSLSKMLIHQLSHRNAYLGSLTKFFGTSTKFLPITSACSALFLLVSRNNTP